MDEVPKAEDVEEIKKEITNKNKEIVNLKNEIARQSTEISTLKKKLIAAEENLKNKV